jgi:hypothetical protein
MIKWKEIPDMYKFAVAVVLATVFVLTYHNQFMTVEAAEKAEEKHDAKITLLIVTLKESEKRTRIGELAKAKEAGDIAEAERIDQDIQTLRDEIISLCDQIDEC